MWNDNDNMRLSYQHCHATVSLGAILEGLPVALVCYLMPDAFQLFFDSGDMADLYI